MRYFTIFKALTLGAIFFCCSSYAVELKNFTPNDEWTFLQSRIEPGHPDTSNEIRFSMLFKKKNGDNVLGWAKAITNSGQVIWQPIESLPETNCLRDFVGRTNLDLANSCKDGLKVGLKWKSKFDYGGTQEQIDFIATGEELINVAAGTFSAIRIQGTGKRISSENNVEDLKVTCWFAPKAKALVRSIREYSAPDGALSIKIVDELTVVNVK